MLSPFTVANCPLTALPVRIVKLSPMTGTKPLISLTESVPPRLTPFETATSPNVPAVLPPIEIFSVAVELCGSCRGSRAVSQSAFPPALRRKVNSQSRRLRPAPRGRDSCLPCPVSPREIDYLKVVGGAYTDILVDKEQHRNHASDCEGHCHTEHYRLPPRHPALHVPPGSRESPSPEGLSRPP